MTFELKDFMLIRTKTRFSYRPNTPWTWFLGILASLLILRGVWAQVDHRTVEELRTIYPSEWGLPHPAGLAYSLDHDHLALLAKRNPDQPTADDSTIVVITPYEDLVGTASLAFVADNAVNIAYDDGNNHLLLLNNQQAELARVAVEKDGLPDPDTLARFDIAHLGLENAAGMDVDLAGRRLFILDSGASEVVSADLDNGFDLISKIDLSYLEATSLRGLAVHPVSHNFFVVSPSEEILYELTPSGQLLNTYDLAVLELIDSRGLAFGPSADLTDVPDTIHLFVADSSLPDDGTANQAFGRLLEVALDPEGNGTVRFAVIGDYGDDNTDEARVATLVDGWNPDFVITTGDNNYPDGEAATIDDTIGQYYSQFIGNYQGSYGPGSPTNRFWPSLGNHDWHTITCAGNSCAGAYFDYFTLPNNERYYEIDLGLVHLFAIDSDSDEPDGRSQNSIQADWLRNQLATSTSCYNLVYFHHAAYSSGRHGSNSTMQWPFSAWGADAIFSGHDHLYERLDVSGTPYFVNGAGGASLYDFDNLGNLPPEAASIVRYNQDHGAMLVTATSTDITYQFYNAEGDLIDDYTVTKNCAASSRFLIYLPLVLRSSADDSVSTPEDTAATIDIAANDNNLDGKERKNFNALH